MYVFIFFNVGPHKEETFSGHLLSPVFQSFLQENTLTQTKCLSSIHVYFFTALYMVLLYLDDVMRAVTKIKIVRSKRNKIHCTKGALNDNHKCMYRLLLYG